MCIKKSKSNALPEGCGVTKDMLGDHIHYFSEKKAKDHNLKLQDTREIIIKLYMEQQKGDYILKKKYYLIMKKKEGEKEEKII